MSRRSVLSRSVLAACCGALAACGGSSSNASSLESALAARHVATLFAAGGLAGVKSATCVASPVLAGDFSCTARPVYRPCSASTKGPCASRLAPTEVWIACFPDQGAAVRWMCQLVRPPAGVPVFTTAAQRAAPKHGLWQCKAFNADHIRIGPFFLATNDPHGPLEQRGGDMTVGAARALASRLHLRIVVDC